MGLAAFYGEPSSDDKVSVVVNKAIELGSNHFDTAEIYRSGDFGKPTDENTVWNEAQLGKALKGRTHVMDRQGPKLVPSRNKELAFPL